MNEPAVRHVEHEAAPLAENVAPATSTPMVERAFRLLDALSTSEDGLTFSELARALDISKGSLHGLLKALARAQAVEQNGGRRFVVGPRIHALALASSQRAGLRRFALPAMRRLAEAVGETIFLGRVEGDGVRVVARCESERGPSALHISAATGTQVPLLAAALGRVVLATWPPLRREQYLVTHALPRFTVQTITDPMAFLASVTVAAETGMGMDREEYLSGVNAVAVPIRGLGGGQLAGILWTVGFAARLDEEAMQRAGDLLRAEADLIAYELGAW